MGVIGGVDVPGIEEFLRRQGIGGDMRFGNIHPHIEVIKPLVIGDHFEPQHSRPGAIENFRGKGIQLMIVTGIILGLQHPRRRQQAHTYQQRHQKIQRDISVPVHNAPFLS